MHPLDEFFPKPIQGLYSFAHYERKDGAWFQVSVDIKRTEVTYCPHQGAKFLKFNSLRELAEYLEEEGKK